MNATDEDLTSYLTDKNRRLATKLGGLLKSDTTAPVVAMLTGTRLNGEPDELEFRRMRGYLSIVWKYGNWRASLSVPPLGPSPSIHNIGRLYNAGIEPPPFLTVAIVHEFIDRVITTIAE